MSVTVNIAQPCYLPWLPHFDRIRLSDVHVVLDHVQLEKGGYTNRTRIRQRDGRVCWLTVPVEKGKPINETRVMGCQWEEKHRETLRQAYGIETPIYMADTIDQVNAEPFDWLTFELGERWPTIEHSSEMGGVRLGAKSELVLNICKELGATRYLSGPMGRDYLDIPAFEKAGIEVVYYTLPVVGVPLSAVHDLFSGEEFAWPQARLISAHC